MVQLEIKRRKDSGRRTICNSPFAGKLICGDCGEIFGSKVWHSTSKYRRTIWQCNAKFKGDRKCTTPHLYEDEIKALFVKALSKLLADRNALFEDGMLIRKTLMDMTEIDAECDELLGEMEVTAVLMQKCIDENAANAIDQDEYASKFSALTEKHEKLKSRYDALLKQCERRLWQADVLGGFLFAIKEIDMLQLEFNPTLWHTTVDHVTVYADERLVFKFRNGNEVEVGSV